MDWALVRVPVMLSASVPELPEELPNHSDTLFFLDLIKSFFLSHKGNAWFRTNHTKGFASESGKRQPKSLLWNTFLKLCLFYAQWMNLQCYCHSCTYKTLPCQMYFSEELYWLLTMLVAVLVFLKFKNRMDFVLKQSLKLPMKQRC